MSGEVFGDDFDRADGALGQNGDAWTPLPAGWGITSWRGKPTTLPGPEGVLTFPIEPYPPYPRRDGQPLRGWARLRFRLVLLSYGHSVSSLQRTARTMIDDGVLVDGLPGPQTWFAFYAIIRRERRR